MQITYLGHCCFKIRDKNVALLTDPASPKAAGFTIPKTEADIVTISHHDLVHDDLTRLKNEPFVIDAPGEYELKGVSVVGLPAGQAGLPGDAASVVFLIEMEGLRVCHLSNLSHLLTDKELEDLDGVDVLLVSVGQADKKGLSVEEIVKLINQIEPSVVVPMRYTAAELDEFLKEYGSEGEKMEKLVVSKGGLGEETKVIILQK